MKIDDGLFGHWERDMIDGSFDKIFIWLRNPSFSTCVLPAYVGVSGAEPQIFRKVSKKTIRISSRPIFCVGAESVLALQLN